MNVPIIGQTRPKVNIEELPVLECPKCGNIYFEPVQVVRVMSVHKNLEGHDETTLIPQQLLQCKECKYVLGGREDNEETNEQNKAKS